MIEYALLTLRKKGMEQIEDELNGYTKKGWRVCEMNESFILLHRKVRIEEED